MKDLDEKTVENLERRIPELAEGAVKQAHAKALASGRKVVEAVNGELIESHPDGSFTVLKKIQPPVAVVPGQKKVRKKS